MTLCSLQIIAAFGFGEQIGAIGAWENGEDLNMIKANDEKSKIIALVKTTFFSTSSADLGAVL